MQTANRFPGIDPFIEAQGAWPDFHSRFMNAWCEAIAEQLPDNYDARLDERLAVVEFESDRSRQPLPDIAVSKSPRLQSNRSASSTAVAEPPLELKSQRNRIPELEEVRETFIEIRRLPDRQLVCVLELLSPTNKVGDGLVQYLAKRQEILRSEAHLVELDLLIDGKRLPTEEPLGPAHFHAIISRAGQRPNCDVYSWSLEHRMPALPVPLAPPDPDIMINLAEVLATTYQRGRYYKTVRYDSPLSLPLSDEYQAWIGQQLAAK